VAAVLGLLALLAGCHSITRRVAIPASTPSPVPASDIPSPAPARSSPTAVPSTPVPPSPRTVAGRKLAAIAAHLPPGAISVAVLDTRTGATFHWGATHGMWTGSVYKLLSLETLLMQRQHSGSWLAEDELEDITAMMEKSDNEAGYRIYLDAGGSTALAATARRLGLRHTSIGRSDPALTTMNAQDGLALLRPLTGRRSLDARSQRFVLDLMRNVQADQRWGVGAVADGTGFANKNGWMDVSDTNGPGEDDHDRWLVDSLGIVRVGGHRMLIAIFTKHNPDCYTGIDLVERLAGVVAPAVMPLS
jgi:beta-lactamase class A